MRVCVCVRACFVCMCMFCVHVRLCVHAYVRVRACVMRCVCVLCVMQLVTPSFVQSNMTEATRLVFDLAPGLAYPTPDRFVASALRTVGKETVTAGYWPHELEVTATATATATTTTMMMIILTTTT